jgi:tetratricopeptide (TPR) repeat protein
LQHGSVAPKSKDYLKSLQQKLRSRLIRDVGENERDRWLIIFDDWHPAALPWAQLSDCLPQDGTGSGVVLINSEVNDGSMSISPPTEIFKMKGLAVEDGVGLLRDTLQRNHGSSAVPDHWLPDDFEDKAEGLAQRFCELPGALFLVGQQIRERHLTIQVALEINGSVNEVIWNMVSRLEDDLNKSPKELALNTLLLFVLAHLNTHCDIVDIFVSAAHTLRKHPNQELVIPPENIIPYLDDGLEPDKMGSKIQLALSELQRRHFLNLREDNKSIDMEVITSCSIHDLLGSREQTSRYWLTAARLLALARLGPLGSKKSITHLTMTQHVDKLLSFQPRDVQLVNVQVFSGPTSNHAQLPTTAAECFADVFSDCGFLQRALGLRKVIYEESRQSDNQNWRFLTCTAFASAFADVENWLEAVNLCQEAIDVNIGEDRYNTLSALADLANYLWKYGNIKQARKNFGRLIHDLEEAWDETRDKTVLRLWLKVAGSNAKILTENASDCKEGRSLLVVVLKSHQDLRDSMKLPDDDKDLLSAKADLACACLQDGAPEDALELDKHLLKVYNGSSAYCLEIISTFQRMAECYSELGRKDRALEFHEAAYRLLEKFDKEGALVSARTKEDTLFSLATAYLRYEDFQKARQSYLDVRASQQFRKASSTDLCKSWRALVSLRIDEVRKCRETFSDDICKVIIRDLDYLTKLVSAARHENETRMLPRCRAQIGLEEIKIKFVDLELSRREKSWWPENYERPLEMAVSATKELEGIYAGVEQEFGDTGALTLACALAFGRGHTLRACIKDKLRPGPPRDSRYKDVKIARIWLNRLKGRVDASRREHREANRYLGKLKRSFGAEEDMCGQGKMDEGLKPFLLWLLGLVCAVLYCYYYQ